MAVKSKKRKPVGGRVNEHPIAPALLIVLVTLVAVPLTFSTAVHRIYVLPRFAVLMIGSSVILALLALGSARGHVSLRQLRSRHSSLVLGSFVITAVSTALGVAPIASLFGTFENQMGLITRLSFIICYSGAVIAIGRSNRRFQLVLWTVALTGLVVACYATAQFLGYDPFVPAAIYSFESSSGRIVRVIGTLGHSNYLGNFLLYTTPVSAALAISSGGRLRAIALATTIVSAAAIVLSGTRGAWLGLATAALTFGLIERRFSIAELFRSRPRRVGWPAAATVAAVVLFLGLILSTGTSRTLGVRLRSFVTDNFSGSGRVLLWQDSLRMIPRFSFIGCGPEAFRRAFLDYKSKELARLAPLTNNESSHNSYLDAAISSGLLGLGLYVGMIVSAFSLLWRARGRAAGRNDQVIMSGLLSALAAVAVHNFFIFDQIPTGLYFMTMMSLAVAALNVAGAGSRPLDAQSQRPERWRVTRWTATGVAFGAVFVVSWYAVRLVDADVEIKRALDAASAGRFEQLMRSGSLVAAAPDPAGSYHFTFARALSLYAEVSSSGANRDRAARTKALDLAVSEARRPPAHSMTPDSDNLLLAYIAYQQGNADRQHFHAAEAIRWDKYYSNSHWLLAEALLAEGNREEAVAEADLALEINPSNTPARSVLKKARGTQGPETIEGMIEASRSLAARGLTNKAERFLIRAIRRSVGGCPDCHRELAALYEASGLVEKAIAEWETYIGQAGAEPTANAREHVAELKRRNQAPR
jgi:O-antigen ligase/tetratricopeptide (TPR) repeat protein